MWIRDYKQKLIILDANMKRDMRKAMCDAMIHGALHTKLQFEQT